MKKILFFCFGIIVCLCLITANIPENKWLEFRKNAYIVFTTRTSDGGTLDTLGWIDSTGVHMRAGWFDSLPGFSGMDSNFYIGNKLSYLPCDFSDCELERIDWFSVKPNAACQGVAWDGDYVYTTTHIDSASNSRKAIYKWTREGILVDSFIQTTGVTAFGDADIIKGKLYVIMDDYPGTDSSFVKIFDLDLNPIDSSPLLTRHKYAGGLTWYNNCFWVVDAGFDTVFKYDESWNIIKAYPLASGTSEYYEGIDAVGNKFFMNQHEVGVGSPSKLFEYEYNAQLDTMIEIKQWDEPGVCYTQGIDFVDEHTIMMAGRAFTPNKDTVAWFVFKPAITYSINVIAGTTTPMIDGETNYFGVIYAVPETTAGRRKVYIRKAGTIKTAEIYVYAETAGTGEAWSMYIRKNNTTDYLIATVSAATNERVFSNTVLNIPVVSGDYIEIKQVQPTWATNPDTVKHGGYIGIK